MSRSSRLPRTGTRLWLLLVVVALGAGLRRLADLAQGGAGPIHPGRPARPSGTEAPALAPPRRRRHSNCSDSPSRSSPSPDRSSAPPSGPGARAGSSCCSTCRSRWRPPTSTEPARVGQGRGAELHRRSRRRRRGRTGVVRRRRAGRGRTDARSRPRATAGIEGLELDESTAIGDAIAVATDLLTDAADDEAEDDGRDDDLAPGAIVLLTDGETTVGRPTVDGADGCCRGRRPRVHDRLRHRRRFHHRPDQR